MKFIISGLVALTLSTHLFAAQTDITGPSGSGQFGTTVTTLPNGNFVVTDPSYTVAGAESAGRVYLYNGKTLALISTMTGTAALDTVGSDGVTILANGDFVVTSSSWNGNLGAVTHCSAVAGCPSTITSSNSLVGTNPDDAIGSDGVVALPNGSYVVRSSNWSDGISSSPGAITWCDGDAGCVGLVSAANSRVGSDDSDNIGRYGIVVLANGNFVSIDPFWSNNGVDNAGAVTFCSGSSPCIDLVSSTNSLVGTTVGEFSGSNGVFPLPSGNYVVCNGGWNNDVGAATFCDGTVGCHAVVSAANSLTGSNPGDQVGVNGVTVLRNGNYVVLSPFWDGAGVSNGGAATFCNGSSGCRGVTVSTLNSLYGTSTSDSVGRLVTALVNGNYVVSSPDWDNTAAGKLNIGAATLCNGNSGRTGAVSVGNSLTGATNGDRVGASVVALNNGNYTVVSQSWTNAGTGAAGAGAVTLCSGTAGLVAQVSSSNSLVGSQANDAIGNVAALAGGNYVVTSGSWNNGATTDAGAAVFCNGSSGCSGTISPATSLIGSGANNQVGGSTPAVALANGNYLVLSPGWDNGATTNVGAITTCSGTVGCGGFVSAANSLIGSTANDSVGSTSLGAVTALANGNFLALSELWNNGGITDAGAVTYGLGVGGTVGAITAANSVRGAVINSGFSLIYSFDLLNNQLVVGRPAENVVTVFPQGAPQSPTLRINSVLRLANGHVVIAATGVPNGSHTVLRSASPGSGFVAIGTITANSAGALQLEDTSSAGLNRAYYKLSYP